MKHFKNKVLYYFCFFFLLLIVSFSVDVFRIDKIDYSIDQRTHTIIWGPSTTACSLNDSILNRMVNLSRHGASYTQTFPILKKKLNNNPNIDTILISFGRFHFFYFNDNQLLLDAQDYQWVNTSPLLTISSYKYIGDKVLCTKSTYFAFVSQVIKQLITGFDYSIDDLRLGYTALDRQHLFQEKQWGISWYDSILGNIPYSENWIMENCKNSINGIRDILQLCEEHNVTPVLFCTPLFEYERWCPKSVFLDFIKNNFSPNILIADYEDFKFPDSSYYGDVHHLNSKGADYFSNYLYLNGINPIPLKDYTPPIQSQMQ